MIFVQHTLKSRVIYCAVNLFTGSEATALQYMRDFLVRETLHSRTKTLTCAYRNFTNLQTRTPRTLTCTDIFFHATYFQPGVNFAYSVTEISDTDASA